MFHSRFTARRIVGVTLLFAASAVSAACPGTSHFMRHGEAPDGTAPAAGACCGGMEMPTPTGHDDHDPVPPPTQLDANEGFEGDPYVLDTDPVSDAKLSPVDRQVIIDYEGRELRFADEQNAAKLRADPATYLAKIDAIMIRQQMPLYALPTCPVSGRMLGTMSEPIDFVFRNRLVRLCCAACKTGFMNDPARHVAKLDAAAIAAQGKVYPTTTCVVSGEPLDGGTGEPVDVVIGNRLIRLGCDRCVEQLRHDPLTYLAKLPAYAKRGAGRGEGANDPEATDHR